MNEFIELEILTEAGIIYEAGQYIEQLINDSYNSKYHSFLGMKNTIRNLNSKFSGDTDTEIRNCSQIKCVYTYIQPMYGFEHTIYQIEFIDKTSRYISQDQYKKLREVLLNTKK